MKWFIIDLESGREVIPSGTLLKETEHHERHLFECRKALLGGEWVQYGDRGAVPFVEGPHVNKYQLWFYNPLVGWGAYTVVGWGEEGYPAPLKRVMDYLDGASMCRPMLQFTYGTLERTRIYERYEDKMEDDGD